MIFDSTFVRWLLGIDHIPSGAQELELAWEHPWPGWVWALLILALGAFAVWTYSRLAGRPLGRWALAGVRLGVLALLMVVLSGPLLQMPRETVEQDWIVNLVDRSASMTIADVPADGGQGGAAGRMSRDAQLRDLLVDSGEMWRELGESRQLLWLGFHYGAFNLSVNAPSGIAQDADADVAASPPVALPDPTGQSTSINAAIEQALQRTAARPVSGIVLFSDGRSGEEISRLVLRRLQAERIPVFVVPLGSAEPVGDMAIRRVDAPRTAFIRDEVPVTAHIDRLGEEVAAMGATLRLIDTQTGEELDRETIAPNDPRDEITLTATPQLAGDAAWQIVIDTDEPDLIPDNNVRPLAITLIDRPLRVLFVEGYPRWEYRYLKNLLVREESIDSSVFLVSADRDFAQEGNQPITRLPNSPEEYAEFDVIMLGDVPGGFFSGNQLEMIRQHVAVRGAGLLCVGGERAMPASYSGNVIADLLPIRGSLNLQAINSPVNMQATDLAQRLGVLQLATGHEAGRQGGVDDVGWPRDLADPAVGWSKLYWAQRIEPGLLKPTAEVLAETVDEFSGSRLPLVVSMRYGAGQTIYVATDEIWRWRWGRGEALLDQFWVQMIRHLGRQSLSGAGQRASLTASPLRVAVRQPVQITLQLLDESLVEPERDNVMAVVQDAQGQVVAQVRLNRPGGGTGGGGGGEGGGRLEATWFPSVTGDFTVRLKDTDLTDLRLESALEVFAPDDELVRPETDHERLENLALATGGRVLDASGSWQPEIEEPGPAAAETGAGRRSALHQLPDLLPNRSVRTIHPVTDRLWDSPAAFGLLLLLLVFEWVGRKVMRLA